MNRRIFEKVTKHKLKNIKPTKSINPGSKKTIISLKCSDERIKQEYNIKNDKIELEYVCGRYIFYLETDKLYDLSESDLHKIMVLNEYYVIYFDKNIDFMDDAYFLIKKLLKDNIMVLPLEDRIYVNEEIEIHYIDKDSILKSEKCK